MPPRILLIEDDVSAGAAFEKVLRKAGYEVLSVSRGEEGLAAAVRQQFDLVLTDFKLPGVSGLELISKLRASQPRLPIIMMTAHGTTETAIQATKLGAYEYLVKPFEVDELLDLVASVVEQSRLMTEEVELGESHSAPRALVGNSRVMQSIYKQIGRIAATPVTVLIRGETGTGKELVARAIYQHSERADKPFIAINCAAIPETLLESELFGHERGAFTGAQSQRIGRFEQASGGTIFLDEIGDLPQNTQSKLLRVLQERHIQRLGGNELLAVDVRVLAATHCDIETAIREKEFREDLFYRLNGVVIQIPPLRERREDIPSLVEFFIQRDAHALGVESPSIQSDALSLLGDQFWPGNVRELENAVRQALLLARPFAINPEHVKQVLAQGRKAVSVLGAGYSNYVRDLLSRVQRGEEQDAYARVIADLEPELFTQAFRLAQGNQGRAARWLGVTRLKLREKLRQLGLHQ
ncbi:MAG: sigma-54-dependent Fis family transcriptional regulator [Verrucomicrobiae bacterium]|nr:sigma-54-dependent Fis family transcriptional regulator [Verrucomicrobiae bacterium]